MFYKKTSQYGKIKPPMEHGIILTLACEKQPVKWTTSLGSPRNW